MFFYYRISAKNKYGRQSTEALKRRLWENVVKGFKEYTQEREREEELQKEVSTSADPQRN